MLTDTDLSELDLPDEIFVSIFVDHFAGDVLRHNINLNFPNFIHNFLNIELDEAIEGRDLLGDEAVLLEITSYNRPSILLINVIWW